DFFGDGKLSLYVAGQLFQNVTTDPANTHFVEASVGLPHGGTPPLYMFEEGAKFLDWNNDGFLDLVTILPGSGPRLFVNNGLNQFSENTAAFTSTGPCQDNWFAAVVNGINVYDLDNDGNEDVVLSQGSTTIPMRFYRATGQGAARKYVFACVDGV